MMQTQTNCNKLIRFKVVLLGTTYVGKTALATRFSQNTFKTTTATIGAIFTPQNLLIDDTPVKLDSKFLNTIKN